METQPTENKSAMLEEVRRAREEATVVAKSGGASENEEELPVGSSALASAPESEGQGEAPAAAPEEAAPAAGEAEELITIGDREFKTQAEAIKYAESLAFDKSINDAYANGVREALQANRPAEVAEPVEDNFDERFFTNPKAAINEAEERATAKALAMFHAEQKKEKMWNDFLTEYPNIRRRDAERVLGENWETIGKMTDVPKAMKVLATKVRAEYEEIADLAKPRTELAAKPARVVSSGSGSAPSVTQPRKEETPLTFVQEMRQLREKR